MEPADLERTIAAVAAHKHRWPAVDLPARVALLRQSIDGCVAVADEMAIAGCRAKGLDPDSPAGAEEWFSGPVPVIRNLRLLADTLTEVGRSGHPHATALKDRHHSGKTRVRVFPDHLFDRLLYPGVTIDVWLDTEVPTFVQPEPAGGVCLVLGAGNVASIGLMDLLYKLFIENRVVILKLHPINDYIGPYVERAFAPLIDSGYVRVVYGDADVGQYLVAHPAVDDIHLTGSAVVHDRIAGSTSKPITSELGCVTPVIVVPGEWSDAELSYQVENVATMVALNASCNCNAAKVIVTWRAWPQRDRFLDRLRNILSALPPRMAYYPGSAAKYARFLQGRAGYDGCETAAAGATLPFVTLFDIDPNGQDEVAFSEEAWSPVVAETALNATDDASFLADAVGFCNDRLAGTLSAVVLADPISRARLGAAFDQAISDLRYGTVAINHWSAVSYALANAPWGAYPGHTRAAVGSGIGVVHNTRMLDHVVKSVLDAPFTTRPKPAWFVTHPRAQIVARRMVRFEASPSWLRLPALAWAAYRD